MPQGFNLAEPWSEAGDRAPRGAGRGNKTFRFQTTISSTDDDSSVDEKHSTVARSTPEAGQSEHTAQGVFSPSDAQRPG
jgi:hypothetical protein